MNRERINIGRRILDEFEFISLRTTSMSVAQRAFIDCVQAAVKHFSLLSLRLLAGIEGHFLCRLSHVVDHWQIGAGQLFVVLVHLHR